MRNEAEDAAIANFWTNLISMADRLYAALPDAPDRAVVLGWIAAEREMAIYLSNRAYDRGDTRTGDSLVQCAATLAGIERLDGDTETLVAALPSLIGRLTGGA